MPPPALPGRGSTQPYVLLGFPATAFPNPPRNSAQTACELPSFWKHGAANEAQLRQLRAPRLLTASLTARLQLQQGGPAFQLEIHTFRILQRARKAIPKHGSLPLHHPSSAVKVSSCGRRRAVRPSSSRRGSSTAGPLRARRPRPGPVRPRFDLPPPRSSRRSPTRSAGGGPGGGAQGAVPGFSQPHSPLKKGGKKNTRQTAAESSISSRTLPREQRAQRASLDPFRGHGKRERGRDVSHKRKQRANPTPKRPPPRALRAARTIRSHPAPCPHSHKEPRTAQAAPRAPAGSRQLPQPPPRRPFIAAPISRGDGRGAPGPFLPSRLPGPPAGAA